MIMAGAFGLAGFYFGQIALLLHPTTPTANMVLTLLYRSQANLIILGSKCFHR